MATIEERLKKIIKDQLDIEDSEFVPRARLIEDFRADITDLVEIQLAIAEEFHLDFGEAEMEEIVTIGNALDYLKEHVKGEQG
jgi:acyl carrier protein